MPSVLITGAGRGIGRAAAERLAAAGWQVLAGVRDASAAPPHTTPVVLDVTNAEHVAALDAALPERLDAVVNNAGIAVSGPVEALPLDMLRRQLEVNLVGQLAVTQAVLPRLRASRGRVVFVSSLSGRVATPMTGAYNASKFALEGLADSLRMELRPWGIGVSLIEPAQTDTDMWREAEAALDADLAQLTAEHRELYAKHIAGARKMIPRSQKLATPAAGVVAAMERALTAKRPKARYVVGTAPKIQGVLAQVTPTRALDAALRAATGVPRKP
jgi:NAD(P)-dependent dehydrogenase (short-subunit alcohol dehydrogenase family)